MNAPRRLLVFLLDEQRYGIAFDSVERVVRVVEITPLPKAPDVVIGVVDVQGRMIAVVDPRRRFGLPAREIELGHQLVIARTARRTVAMLVDAVTGLIEHSERDVVPMEKITPGTEQIAGVMRQSDGLVLIHDLERFLSLDEERSLERAMAHA